MKAPRLSLIISAAVLAASASLLLRLLALLAARGLVAFAGAPETWQERGPAAVLADYPPEIGPSYPEDAHPTDKQQQWALSTCSVLFQLNGHSHDILGGVTNYVQEERRALRQWWGVENREGLLDALTSLRAGGHRRLYDEWVAEVKASSPRELRRLMREAAQDSQFTNRLAVVLATRERFVRTGLAGWDYSRYVALCRWGFRAGYLTEEEAWSRIMPVARMLQGTFSSWRELADNYIEGRRFWSVRQTVEDSENLASCYSFLLSNENFSPLCRLPWKTSLLPAQRRDDGSAEFRMGRAQFYCFGDYSCDKPAGRRARVGLIKEAAAKGNVDAMFLLGSCYLFGEGVEKDYREAQRWFRHAADLGDACAQYQIGKLYYWGQGVARDHNQAAFWAYQAVSNGAGPHAEAYIGWCYERGAGLPKNMTNAFVFYRAAVDEGVVWVQVNLAEMYEKGNGVQKDIRSAAALYEKAAHNGDVGGMCSWARYLESGEAGVTNRTEAVNWYRRSAAKGNKQAKKRLAALGEPEVAPPAPGS